MIILGKYNWIGSSSIKHSHSPPVQFTRDIKPMCKTGQPTLTIRDGQLTDGYCADL